MAGAGVLEATAAPAVRRGPTTPIWALIGALVGVAGAVIGQLGPWWAAALVHYAVPYIALIALIGSTAPGARAAALRAAVCFVAFVLAYYAVVAVQFGAVPILYAAAWLVAAATVCPLAAVAVRWAVNRSGVLPAAVLAGAGATALSDGALGNLVRVGLRRLDPSEIGPEHVVDGLAGLVVALAITLVVPRRRRTRVAATVLLVPFAVIATHLGWAAHFGIGPYLR